MSAGSKIAFFYPSYYPITGGSSVHGYYLAQNLTQMGYRLITFTDKPDGFTNFRKRNLWNVLFAIISSDLVYVRIGTGGISRKIPAIAKLFGKKVIAEVNGPADELAITKSKNQLEIKKADNSLSRVLRNADAVITVSELMETYCRETLHCKNVVAIENGGEQFNSDLLQLKMEFSDRIRHIREKAGKIVIWSGTTYPWQGFEKIQRLIELAGDDIQFFLVSNDKEVWKEVVNRKNVFCFEQLSRDETAFLLIQADVGLAIYGDFSWSRFKEFHGSSLKYYEYMANGLCVIASPTGHLKNATGSGVLVTDDVSEMLSFISDCHKRERGFPYRSWKDVALETATVIKSIV